MSVDKFLENLTPAQAYEIMRKANEYAVSLPLPGWATEELEQAMDDEITDGTRPMQTIPRYQAALMADRAYRKAIEEAITMLKGDL